MENIAKCKLDREGKKAIIILVEQRNYQNLTKFADAKHYAYFEFR